MTKVRLSLTTPSAPPVRDLALDRMDAVAIADTVREPLLVLDDRLIVRFANLAFFRHFGLQPETVTGRTLSTVGGGEWGHPDLGRLLEEVLPTGTRFDDFEFEHDFGELGRRVLSLNANEIVVADTPWRCILLVMEDVTDRRRAEAALTERTRELERFTMIASHDLQEPLRKIRTYGAMLLEECAPVLGPEGADYVARMAGAAARMQSLIEDLLVLARTSTAAPCITRVDLAEVLRDVLVDLEVAIREADATVVLGELPSVLADPVHMRQLFQNLLSNAVKFRRPAVPLRVVVETRPAADAAAMHEIVVRDNGIGFDARYAETIFGPFERLHGRLAYAGNGVGLAVCRRIVERHGGRIVARSVPDHGATFTVSLPLVGALQRTPQTLHGTVGE